MAKLRIQINGEDVREIEGDISLVEIKSSKGYVGEFVPDGLARVNVVVNTRGDFVTHLDDAHPESAQSVEDADHKPVEEQVNEDSSENAENAGSSDFLLPTE